MTVRSADGDRPAAAARRLPGGCPDGRIRSRVKGIAVSPPVRAEKAGAAVLSIDVAGRPVEDPLAVFAAYCHRHGRTIRAYDWLAGTHPVLTPELIKVTRSPWMGSRISREQEYHLLRLSETAPWDDVPVHAHLRDADPMRDDGLYNRALGLYRHFLQDRPRALGHAKVSKALHLVRPGLFLILDSALLKRYRQAAEVAARDLAQAGSRHAPPRRAYWAAYRQDVVRAADGLAQLRAAASAHHDPLVVEAAGRLSDVRLLDILAWMPDRQDAPSVT
ncbi:DUF6308 family protein [Micromonospora sp. 4G55]|uniref:DUF6308 family protein n=1 Tax=Micromonospora sp. 4G55 TaxID=2806102 RepID=UPI001A5CA881|nr:DUF6308 family protein [Micromonospora sp. 4G55]MBM0255478.1 hypothetical protein [Micromonospora sp. 4G55]